MVALDQGQFYLFPLDLFNLFDLFISDLPLDFVNVGLERGFQIEFFQFFHFVLQDHFVEFPGVFLKI